MWRPLLLLTLVGSCFAGILTEEQPENEVIVSDPDIEPEGQCQAQAGDLEKLYYDSGEWLNIFVDVPFKCRGRVTKWQLYAKRRGKVFLTVWRPRPNGNAWNLVGKNLVHARSRGLLTFFIERKEQIRVLRGDVIGMQYPRDDPDAEIPTLRGVVSFENDADFVWPSESDQKSGSTFPFSRIHNKQEFDDDIDPEKTRRGVRNFMRRAALAAFTNEADPCQPNPCQNGGTCVIDGDNYECQCPPEFIGKHCTEELECELAGGPLEHLSYDSGTWLNIFKDFSFPCSGRVVEWRFYAKKRGQMYLSVWRPTPGVENSWEIVGKNLIRVKYRGEHRVTINKANQIQVQAGDVFGIHYPDSLANDKDDRGIIPYVDTRVGGPGLCCNMTEDQLSVLYNVNVQDTYITENPVQDGPFIRDFKRAVALFALVHNPICGLQFGPRRNLSYDSGMWLNVFVNKPVECSGRIVRWEFFAKKTGDIFLSVWQGNMADGFVMRGKSRFTVTKIGTQVIDIPEDQQLGVSPDDVLGLHYPNRVEGEDDRGIIPYRNNEDFPWWTSLYMGDDDYAEEQARFDFLQIHNVDVQDGDIGPDYVAGGPYRPFERFPAFAIFVDESLNGNTVQVM